MRSDPRLRAVVWGGTLTILLAVAIVVGSRDLAHFDAALVGYTFATPPITMNYIWQAREHPSEGRSRTSSVVAPFCSVCFPSSR